MNKKTALNENDQQRLQELTGENRTTLSLALDQWENERQALAELNDEVQALEIYLGKIKKMTASYKKVIKRIVDEGDLFFSQKTRNMISEFWAEVKETEKVLDQSKTVTK